MASKKAKLRLFRVEATVPAIQYVEARTREEAIELACANPGEWNVILDAPIDPDHVVDCVQDDD